MLGRLQLNKVQKAKIAVHVVQALLIFVALCVLIAMLVQRGRNDGRAFWYLALCFLSLPAWVFLVMTPMWERTVRFANAFVMAGVDVVFTIFWFSAFIAVATWNNKGQKEGARLRRVSGNGSCKTFAYGSQTKCELAKAAVGLGVVIFLLWIASSAISIYFLIRWRKGDGLPWKKAQPKTYQEQSSSEAHTKNVWSSDVIEHGDHGSDDGRATPSHNEQQDDEHMLLHGTDMEEGPHPGTPWGPLSNSSDYHGSMQQARDYGEPQQYAPPTALSPAYGSRDGGYDGGYDSYRPGNHVSDRTG